MFVPEDCRPVTHLCRRFPSREAAGTSANKAIVHHHQIESPHARAAFKARSLGQAHALRQIRLANLPAPTIESADLRVKITDLLGPQLRQNAPLKIGSLQDLLQGNV